jgi:hypothetical protein
LPAQISCLISTIGYARNHLRIPYLKNGILHFTASVARGQA